MVSPTVDWFDGEQAQAQRLQLRIADGELQLCAQAEAPPLRRYSLAGLQWPEPLQPLRQLALPDGSWVECDDAPAWDAWLRAAGQPPPAIAWFLRPVVAWLLPGFTLLLVAAAGLWGVPTLTRALLPWVPPAWEQSLGEALMRQVDEEWLEPSRLSESQREQALTTMQPVLKLLEAELVRPNVLFRAAPPSLGPNAFALPGGTIVITDALVRELPGHPALAGVLAHEWGHVKHRHGLQHVARFASWSALASLWLGDASWLLATAPAVLLQASYSRDAEREADAEARRLMVVADIDPREMLHFFALVRQRQGQREDRTEGLGLASHPATVERMRFFEAAP